MRARIGIAVLLLAGFACGGDDTADEEGACTATIKLKDYTLDPSAVEIASGPAVLCAVNEGKTPHDLVVRDASRQDRARSAVLQPGMGARVSVNLVAGSYELYCSVAGHESLGMKGPLTVR
ncbi:MAG: cupredoxin domain-containing protein [Polyangiales bacterium]